MVCIYIQQISYFCKFNARKKHFCKFRCKNEAAAAANMKAYFTGGACVVFRCCGRVVADAKAKGGRASLPGVDWSPLNDGAAGSSAGEAWQATALSQRRPLVMRTSEQFYGTLERYVYVNMVHILRPLVYPVPYPTLSGRQGGSPCGGRTSGPG